MAFNSEGPTIDQVKREEEVRLGSGVEVVVRVGDTIRRTTGPWTPAVHALLRHLESEGFAGAPRLLGIDAHGREILRYIPGDTGPRPWPAGVRTLSSLRSAADLIRRFHSVVETFDPDPALPWRTGTRRLNKEEGEIICHGDLAPWNTVYSPNGTATALLDWDCAHPGLPVDDLSGAAFNFVPLADDDFCVRAGWTRPPDRCRRLRAFVDSYGPEFRAGFVARVIDRKLRQVVDLEDLGRRGVPPWDRFLEEGLAAVFKKEVRWLEVNRLALERALEE